MILQVALSDGVIWELERIVRSVPPEKLVLAVPQRQKSWLFRWRLERKRQGTYREFREKTLTVLPHPLPEAIGKSQFILFDQGWNSRASVPPKFLLFPRFGRPKQKPVDAAIEWLDSVMAHQSWWDRIQYYVCLPIRIGVIMIMLGVVVVVVLALLYVFGLTENVFG